ASIGFYGFKGGIWSILKGGSEKGLGPANSFLDGNTFLGLALNMVVPALVALARDEPRRWLRQMLYLTAALSVVASIFTYSRGAWLGLAIIIPLVLLQLKSKPRIVVGAGLVVSILFASILFPEKIFQRADTIANYDADQSANQRFMAWTVHWNVAKANPFVGAGFEFDMVKDGRYLAYGDEKYLSSFTAARKESAAAHSIYFQILGQHGFVALFIYLWLLVSVTLTLLRVRTIGRKSPDTAWIGTYATGLLIGFGGYGGSGAFLSSAYFDLAWLYFAFAAILSHEIALAMPKRGQAAPAPVHRAVRAGQPDSGAE